MQFNSTSFILFFLPISFVLYFIVPGKLKNGVLLAESLFFYAWGALRFLPLLLILVPADYLIARLIDAPKSGQRAKKALLIVGIVLNIGLLAAFKYGSYLSELLRRIGSGQLAFPDMVPLGLSYYTFKSVSYLCDVYRRKCESEPNLIDYAAYVLMYQQMLVGPIVRYVDIRDALKEKGSRFDVQRCADGLRMFVYGLAKKVLLADTIGLMWQELAGGNGIGLSQASSGLAWFSVVCYSLQLYLDFSGYSEMSNGLSKIMGFDCKANFDYPYCASSMTQFWRRWHITLTEWFRDYVYIPLGGNRNGSARQILNMLIVWILTGIWHGSTVNFLIWGLFHFAFLLIEKYLLKDAMRKHRVFGRIVTLLVAVVGWGIFAAQGSVSVAALLAKLFSFSGGVSAAYFLRNYGIVFLLSALVSGGVFKALREKLPCPVWVENAFAIALLAVCFAYIVGGTGNAALYAAF